MYVPPLVATPQEIAPPLAKGDTIIQKLSKSSSTHYTTVAQMQPKVVPPPPTQHNEEKEEETSIVEVKIKFMRLA